MAQFRMTHFQYVILGAADPKTRIIPSYMVDGRAMPRLARNGWAVRVQDRKRGKRVWFRWEITDTGLEARDHAEIVEPTPRPNWRAWDTVRLSANEYVVRGHTVTRPGQTMLWRVLCPAQREPVGYRSRIAEAADLLADHIFTVSNHGTPRDPHATTGHAEPPPIDLDQLADDAQMKDV